MSEGTTPDRPAQEASAADLRFRVGGAADVWRLRHLLIVVVAAALLVWGYRGLGGWMIVLAVFFLLAMAVGAVVVGIRGRASQRYSLLWMLAIAAEHGMPLATTVEAFAQQYRGRFRRRVLRLAGLLEQGTGLSNALRAVPGLAAADTALLIEVGEENGRLGTALRKSASIQAHRATVGTTLASQAAYLLMLLLIAQGVTFVLMYSILPRFAAIFQDFGVGMPASTRLLYDASRFLLDRFFLMILLPLLTLVLMIIVPRALSAGAGFDLPLIGRLFRKRHTSLILRGLAMTADAGRPIEQGMGALAARYPTRWVRRALKSAVQTVRQGGDWRDALARRELISRADHEVLAAASGVGNLPWAMDDLADASDRRLALRVAMLAQALWPFVILAIGAMVLFLAIGFFAPLVELIGRLSG